MLMMTSSLLMAAVPAAKPTLVVAPLKRMKTKAADAATLAEMIRIRVGQSDRYTLVTPEEMGAIDDELERQLSGGCDVSSCVAGHQHSCGRQTDGKIRCWGANDYGELKAPNAAFVELSAGRFTTCGLRAKGTVTCWGALAFDEALYQTR